MVRETQFEAPRGVSEVEVRHGFAQFQVPFVAGDAGARRIAALKVLADAGISHKYLKLTQDGIAFIVTEDQVAEVKAALSQSGMNFELNRSRSIVLVKAVGMWEEHGMIASILEAATASGVQVDHVGDMHDKMFMVVRGEVAEETAERFRARLMGADA